MVGQRYQASLREAVGRSILLGFRVIYSTARRGGALMQPTEVHSAQERLGLTFKYAAIMKSIVFLKASERCFWGQAETNKAPAVFTGAGHGRMFKL